MIYLKTIRREDITSQVFRDIKDFLQTEISERKGKVENVNQTITDRKEPVLSLSDMSSGSYEAFKNRSD